MVWYGAAVAELAHAARKEPRDLGRGLELDARAEAVADDLAEQHALRALEPRPHLARKAERGARLAARLAARAASSRTWRAGAPPAARRRSSRLRASLGVALQHHLARLRRRAPRRPPRAMSAMPAAMSYSFTPCIDTRRDAVARGDARQAIGDARHRDVARRRDRARPGLRLAAPPKRSPRRRHPGRALRARDRSSPAGRCAGSSPRPRPRRSCRGRDRATSGCMHHAEHRLRPRAGAPPRSPSRGGPAMNSKVPSCGSTSQVKPGSRARASCRSPRRRTPPAGCACRLLRSRSSISRSTSATDRRWPRGSRRAVELARSRVPSASTRCHGGYQRLSNMSSTFIPE